MPIVYYHHCNEYTATPIQRSTGYIGQVRKRKRKSNLDAVLLYPSSPSQSAANTKKQIASPNNSVTVKDLSAKLLVPLRCKSSFVPHHSHLNHLSNLPCPCPYPSSNPEQPYCSPAAARDSATYSLRSCSTRALLSAEIRASSSAWKLFNYHSI